MIHAEGSEEVIGEVPFQEQVYKFDFTQTGVDTSTFPFHVYRKITNEVWQFENKDLLFIGHPQGGKFTRSNRELFV